MTGFGGLRNFIVIWLGQMVSMVGARITTFALGIWVLQTTGSTTQFALIFVAMAVPALLIGPFAGALVDRWDRRWTMIACDATGAIVTFALAGLMLFDQLVIAHIYAGAGVLAIAGAFHQPAYAASIHMLARRDQLGRVNGMVQTSFAVAQVLGPLLAGVLVSLVSISGVLMIDAITSLVGVFSLLVARVPRVARTDEDESSLWHEAAIGWRYVRDRGGLFGLLIVFGSSNFLFGIASIAITPLVLSLTDVGGLGLQMSIGGMGLVLSGIAVTASGGPRRRIHGILGFSLLAGLFLSLHGIAPSYPLIVVAGFLFFFTLPVINSSNATLWQSKVPAALQGRCFAIQRVLAEAAMPIGYCLAGPLAEHLFEPALMPGGSLAGSVGSMIGTGVGRGLGLMFIVLGVLMMLIAIVAYLVPTIRNIEDNVPDIPVDVDVENDTVASVGKTG